MNNFVDVGSSVSVRYPQSAAYEHGWVVEVLCEDNVIPVYVIKRARNGELVKCYRHDFKLYQD